MEEGVAVYLTKRNPALQASFITMANDTKKVSEFLMILQEKYALSKTLRFDSELTRNFQEQKLFKKRY